MPVVQMRVRMVMQAIAHSNRGIIFCFESGNLLINHLPEYAQARKKRYTANPLGATVIKLLEFVIMPVKNSSKTTRQKKTCLMDFRLNNLLIVFCNCFIRVNMLHLRSSTKLSLRKQGFV